MLTDYQEKLLQNRQAHPIEPEDFNAWKNNRITQEFFEDLELWILDGRVKSSSLSESLALNSTLGFADDWHPTTVELPE